MSMELKFDLHEKQGVAYESRATEILYGGAAGGGKSHLMRIAAIVWCLQIPGLQVYLFRRLYDDLIKNHIEGPTGFPALLAPLVASKKVQIVEGEIRFPNGSKIYLCHCQHAKDVIKYQGAEIHVLMIDELTHFLEPMYRFLRGRVRLGGLKLPNEYKSLFPKILTGSNPGSIGHQWVKRTFVDFLKQYEIKKTEDDEGGMLRQYIPATLDDNPTLKKNDPEYEIRLQGLGNPELVKAMRYGLWDITAGAALEKLSREKHMLRPFNIPDHWTKFMAMDWGSAKPFSIGWYTVCEDGMILKAKEHWPERFVPKNALIRYREWYGWNGKPNDGCRMESPEVAKRIMEIEEEAGEEMDYRVGDTSMWSKQDGPSVEERMFNATDGKFQMIQSIKDRENNYQEIRARVSGEDNHPMLYITENCSHFWRTVPDLQLDELHPEKGPDSEQEDHVYDDLQYACASRPFLTTKQERTEREYKKAKKKYGKKRKPY